MAKPSTRFSEVLTVDIHGVGKKTFRTATQVQKWAANELETWQNVKPAMDSNTPFGGRFRFDDMTEHAKGLANHALSYINNPDPNHRNNVMDQIRNQLVPYASHNLVASESPAGQSILNFVKDQQMPAAWVTLVKTRQQCVPYDHVTDLVSFMNGWHTSHADALDPASATEKQRLSLENLRSSWDETLDKRNEEWLGLLASREKETSHQLEYTRTWTGRFKRVALGLSKNYRSLHEDHKDRMGKMERDFSNDMRLRAAEKFWGKKRRLNRRRAETAFKKLCWVGGLGGIVTGLIYWGLYSLIGLPNGWSTGHTLAYVVPTVMYVWLLKIIANEYRVNQHMADDAEEREAMVYTFKALEHEKRVGDDERLVILNALFRPHDKGAEESIPLPAWEAMINKLHKP